MFHSRPCFLRIIPYSVSGTGALKTLLRALGVDSRRIVTVNSNIYSISVVRSTKLNVTVNGTRSSMGMYTSEVAASGSRSKMTVTMRGTVLSRVHPTRIPLSRLGRQTHRTLVKGLNVRCACTSRSEMRTAVPMSRHAHRPFNVLRKKTALTLTRAITKLNSVVLYGPSRVMMNVRIDKGRVSSTRRKSAIETIKAVIRGKHSSRI